MAGLLAPGGASAAATEWSAAVEEFGTGAPVSVASAVSWSRRTAVRGAMRPKSARRPAKKVIVGGAVIGINQAPWQVNVFSTTFDCGGSILSPTTILTAAHCVDAVIAGKPNDQGGASVWAGVSRNDGTPSAGDGYQQVAVTGVALHPSWVRGTATTTGDVAVLTVSPALALDNVTKMAVTLPAAGQPPAGDALVGTPLVATGYGVHTAFTQLTDGALRKLTPTIEDPDFCGVDENAVTVCGKTPTGSTCQGDSGGPVVLPPAAPGQAPVQVGIVSNGPIGCRVGTPDFYTNLWAPEIRQFVAGNTAPPIAPRLGATDPVPSGAPNMRVGETITCAPASFTGATSVETKLTTDDGTLVAAAVNTPVSFTLTGAQVGKKIRCRSYGMSDGGIAVSYLLVSGAAVVAAPVVAPPIIPSTQPVGTCERQSAVVTVSAPKRVRGGQKLVVTATLHGPQAAATSGTAVLKVSSGKSYRAALSARLKFSSSRATARFVHRAKRSGSAFTFKFKAELTTSAAGVTCDRGISRVFSVRFAR